MDAHASSGRGLGVTATSLDTAHWRRAQSKLRRQYLHSFAAAACIGPFLSYVLSDRGWAPGSIGIATALLTLSAVVSAPAWGWLDDVRRAGAAKLSLVATAAAAMLLTLAVLQLPMWAALGAVVILGSVSGSLEALLTTRTLRDTRTAVRLGATRSLGSVGWVLGLGLGGLLLTFTDKPALVFLVAGIAALTAPAPPPAPAPTQDPGHAPDSVEDESPPTPLPGRPPVRAVLGVLSITFPIPVCTAALVFFTAGWAHTDLGAGPLVAVGPLALSAVLELPAFLALDRLAKGVAPRSLCGFAFAPLALAFLALALAPGKITLFAVQPLVAASFALWFIGQSRLMAQRVPLRQLGSALTLLATLGKGVAGPLAGVAGGAIAAAGGYTALFGTLAGLCLFGLLRVFLPLTPA
jgi:MFS transporter, PPP family, 3-phenylpropionic acid transporter